MIKAIDYLSKVDNLIRLARKRGYRIFEDNTKPFNLNIWGVRSNTRRAGEFDDLVVIFWKDGLKWKSLKLDATVDPSDHYLLNPIHKLGTAIVKTGQHIGVWQLGKHRGQYDALVQRKPITVVRDFNKDDILDYQEEFRYFEKSLKANNSGGSTIFFKDANGKVIRIEDTGYFGINLHRASKWQIVKSIGLYSAGCTVIQDPNDYNEAINIIQKAVLNWGNSFTYTLVTEESLLEVV